MACRSRASCTGNWANSSSQVNKPRFQSGLFLLFNIYDHTECSHEKGFMLKNSVLMIQYSVYAYGNNFTWSWWKTSTVLRLNTVSSIVFHLMWTITSLHTFCSSLSLLAVWLQIMAETAVFHTLSEHKWRLTGWKTRHRIYHIIVSNVVLDKYLSNKPLIISLFGLIYYLPLVVVGIGVVVDVVMDVVVAERKRNTQLISVIVWARFWVNAV